MNSILVSDSDEEDTKMLVEISREIMAQVSDEKLFIMNWSREEEFETILKHETRPDVALVDITLEWGIQAAVNLRRYYPDVEILIISNKKISPTLYLDPQVRAISLLLKPLKRQAVLSTLATFFQLSQNKVQEDDCYCEERKGEKIKLPYHKIIYFEAREKQVYARLSNVEYAITETIDHLAEGLTSQFVRCHRSYIVNQKYIEKVRYSDNYVKLNGNMTIPLSRSYKAVLKEVMQDEA